MDFLKERVAYLRRTAVKSIHLGILFSIMLGSLFVWFNPLHLVFETAPTSSIDGKQLYFYYLIAVYGGFAFLLSILAFLFILFQKKIRRKGTMVSLVEESLPERTIILMNVYIVNFVIGVPLLLMGKFYEMLEPWVNSSWRGETLFYYTVIVLFNALALRFPHKRELPLSKKLAFFGLILVDWAIVLYLFYAYSRSLVS